MMRKELLVLLSILLIFFTTLGVLYSNVIFQEGNTLPIFKAIVKLQCGEEIVLVSSETNKYITSSKEGYQNIVEYMSEKSWVISDQLGSGDIFAKGDERIIITSRQYSSHFQIWTIPDLE